MVAKSDLLPYARSLSSLRSGRWSWVRSWGCESDQWRAASRISLGVWRVLRQNEASCFCLRLDGNLGKILFQGRWERETAQHGKSTVCWRRGFVPSLYDHQCRLVFFICFAIKRASGCQFLRVTTAHTAHANQAKGVCARMNGNEAGKDSGAFKISSLSCDNGGCVFFYKSEKHCFASSVKKTMSVKLFCSELRPSLFSTPLSRSCVLCCAALRNQAACNRVFKFP